MIYQRMSFYSRVALCVALLFFCTVTIVFADYYNFDDMDIPNPPDISFNQNMYSDLWNTGDLLTSDDIEPGTYWIIFQVSTNTTWDISKGSSYSYIDEASGGVLNIFIASYPAGTPYSGKYKGYRYQFYRSSNDPGVLLNPPPGCGFQDDDNDGVPDMLEFAGMDKNYGWSNDLIVTNDNNGIIEWRSISIYVVDQDGYVQDANNYREFSLGDESVITNDDGSLKDGYTAEIVMRSPDAPVNTDFCPDPNASDPTDTKLSSQEIFDIREDLIEDGVFDGTYDDNDDYVPSESSYGGGGGLYCEESSNPNLENITIKMNGSEDGTGGLAAIDSSPSLTDVIISENYSYDNVAGIFLFNKC